VLGLAIALLGLAIPRNRRLWIVGSWFGRRFADNGKWFFLAAAQDRKIRAILSTGSRDVCSQLRQHGYPAVRSNTIRGIWTALRAGAYVHDSDPIDANFWAIKGALWVQMWHGVPLKRIERDISDPQHSVVKTLRNLDARKTRSRLRALFYEPWRLKKEDLFCCTSDILVPVFASAFGLPASRVRVTGYPRNDAMWWSSQELLSLEVSGIDECLATAAARGTRVILYVPTFRDDTVVGRPVFEHGWNRAQQAQLDELLRDLNAVMFVKMHPHIATNWNVVDMADTICFLPSDLDVYPILSRVDILITDYSSIFFDYLLLERPVIFYCYDLGMYQSSRGFYFDYDLVTPGPKARTFSELLTAIKGTLQGTVDFSEEITRTKSMFHKFSDGHSSNRIAMEIRAELGLISPTIEPL